MVNDHFRRLGLVVKFSVYAVVPAALIFLIVSLVRWAVLSVPILVESLVSVLLVICILTVVLGFLALGGFILYTVHKSISKLESVTIRVTIITMTLFIMVAVMIIVALEDLGVIILSFQSCLAVLTLNDLCMAIIGSGVALAFAIHSFKELKTSSHHGTDSTPKGLHRASGSELFKRDPEADHRMSTNLDRADDLIQELKPVTSGEGDAQV